MGSRMPRFGVVLAVFLAAGALHAEPTEDQKKTARNAMAEGRELRDEKNYKDAVEAFKKAHAIMKVPTTGLELARTMVLLGQLQEAKAVAAEVAVLPEQPKEPGPFAQARLDAQKLADELELELHHARIDEHQRGVVAGNQRAGRCTGL